VNIRIFEDEPEDESSISEIRLNRSQRKTKRIEQKIAKEAKGRSRRGLTNGLRL
jgi:hypothetical protein